MLYFITGNPGKFREIKALIPEAARLDLDLDELQSLDPRAVIKHKLKQAAKIQSGAFFVEDTNLEIACLQGLPGTFIKWFIQALGVAGIAALAMKHENRAALARTTIGYHDATGAVHYFAATLPGTIVPPQGTRGFGWDSIFIPEGQRTTMAGLTVAAKNRLSMRADAAHQLADFLRAA